MKKFFSFQIIKQSFKSVWIWWLISIFLVSINLFAFPSSIGADNSKLLSIFAYEGLGGNGIFSIMICSILFANVLITSEIDRGTLAITLNTPVTRLQILLSKALVFIVLLTSISLFSGICGSISPLLYGLEFEHTKWWIIMGLWSLYSFAMGGITFLIGCWFNKSRYTLGVSSVLLGIFFVLAMLSTMKDLEFCKYFTLQTLFDVTAIVEGKSVFWQMITLPSIAIPLYIGGIICFVKKDLPL